MVLVGVFHGEIINVREVITFEASSVDALNQAFKDSIDDYLEFCASRNEEPDKPFSGRFIVRLSPELHRKAYIKAKVSAKSLNGWVNEVLEQAIEAK
jgi:predicted HicB family RNase H-like nuclease